MPNRTLIALALSAASALQSPQQPIIRSGVELVLVDVQVTSKDGTPTLGLKPEQFEVSIDGKKRPVVNLEFLQYATNGTAGPAPSPSSGAAPMPPVVDAAPEGRVIMIGVDQASLQLGSEPAAREAVTKLLDMVDPSDLVGLFGVPEPGFSVSPTRDRAPLMAALRKINGQLQIPKTRLNVSLGEAIDVTARDSSALAALEQRECRLGDRGCASELRSTVHELATTFEMQATRSINGLHSLMTAAKEYPGRKTVVIVSAGFPTTDRVGGRPNVQTEAIIAGQRAAEANAVLYSLRLDVGFLLAYSAANAGRGLEGIFRNSSLFSAGLQRFTASAGGTTIDVPVGPEPAIKRLLRETSSYYLLGVEALPEHRDGKTHRIQVKVKQGGAQVRARSAVLIPKAQ
jgi:VWFA-related protein